MKKKKRASTHKRQIIIVVMVISLACATLVYAGIRMTDDPKPKRAWYKVKDVNTGIITPKYVSEDMPFDYEIGDMFEETVNPTGDARFQIIHKYVVIAKKND